MSQEFTLESPFVDYTFGTVPEHWKLILTGWLILWAAVGIGLIYAFAVVFPSFVGFETALLAGVAMLILNTS